MLVSLLLYMGSRAFESSGHTCVSADITQLHVSQQRTWREIGLLIQAAWPELVAILPSNVMAYLRMPNGRLNLARCNSAYRTMVTGFATILRVICPA